MKETAEIMRNKNRLLAIMLTVLIGILGSTITIRSIAIFKYFDLNSGFYSDNTLITISNLILIFGVLIFAVYIFLGKNTKLKADFNTPAIMVTSGVAAIAVIVFAVKMFEICGESLSAPYATFSLTKNPVAFVSLLCGIFGILSCIHFFLNISTTQRVTVLRSYMAMGSIVFLALYAIFLHLNKDVAINSANKIIDQMAFIFSAAFFLYEARISLGADKWHAYIAFGLIASMLIGYSSIPSLIIYFAKGIEISNSIEESVFMFTLFMYSTVRVFLSLSLPKDEESPIIASFSRFAKEQNKKIEENERFYKEKYAVQLSIEDLMGGDAVIFKKNTEDEPTKILETPSEEYIQNSFFTQDTPAEADKNTAESGKSIADEVNYEENSGN